MAILTYQQILELIDKVAEARVSLVEIETGGVRVRVERGTPGSVSTGSAAMSPGGFTGEESAAPMAQGPATISDEGTGKPEEEEDASWHIITSPIVGTFYRSPNPESEAFTEEGARVSKGAVLCIIEAMKLFNEIESDTDGVIARIYPENGQPVEFGEKLFAIKK